FRGVEAESLLLALDLKGIGASAGSACTSGSLEPSYVLTAMGVPPEWSLGAVRCSLGRSTTREDIDYVLETLTPAGGRDPAPCPGGPRPREVNRARRPPPSRRRRSRARPGRPEPARGAPLLPGSPSPVLPPAGSPPLARGLAGERPLRVAPEPVLHWD